MSIEFPALLVVLLVLGLSLGFVAFVSGAVAKERIKKSNGTLTGKGIATAGMILGIFDTVLAILTTVHHSQSLTP